MTKSEEADSDKANWERRMFHLGLLSFVLIGAFTAVQACAARQATSEQSRSLRLHDRPWVVVADGTDVNFDLHTFQITLKNVGALPAQRVAIITRATWIDGTKLPNPSPADAIPIDEISLAVVGAGETTHSTVKMAQARTAEDLMQMNSGAARFFVWGTITYTGPGQDSELQGRTEFCVYLDAYRKLVNDCTERNTVE